MDTEYRRHYRDLFEKHWWWRARSEFVVSALQRLRLPPNQTEILDIGCGDGLFFDRLSKLGRVEGIDVEAALPPDSRWQPQIYKRPFDETFQPAKSYSLVLMLDVLEHMSEPLPALQHVRRLLASNGVFVATVPAFQSAWTNHDVLNEHVSRFTKQSLGDLLEKAGLQVIEQDYFFHWTFFAKLFVRAYERISRQTPKVPEIPPGYINEPLFLFSRAEQKALGWLDIPFGSSLIALAKKAP